MTPPLWRLDPDEPCGLCGRTRKQHWGRRSALAPQELGHQCRPVNPERRSRRVDPSPVEQAQRIPCTDWNCQLAHEILRTGPVFASFHPLEGE